MLLPEFTPIFNRDVKAIARRHHDIEGLRRVMRLVLADDEQSRDELRRRHRAHQLTGEWHGAWECHIENSSDLLLIWMRRRDTVIFVRAGSHAALFR